MENFDSYFFTGFCLSGFCSFFRIGCIYFHSIFSYKYKKGNGHVIRNQVYSHLKYMLFSIYISLRSEIILNFHYQVRRQFKIRDSRLLSFVLRRPPSADQIIRLLLRNETKTMMLTSQNSPHILQKLSQVPIQYDRKILLTLSIHGEAFQSLFFPLRMKNE